MDEQRMNSPEEADRLYLENERLVEYWIKKLYGGNIPGNIEADLYSEGCRSLYRAAEKYNSEHDSGAEFGTYASEWIKKSFLGVWEKANKAKPDVDDTVKPPEPDDFVHEKEGQSVRLGKKEPDRIALQILEVLRMWSDEMHSLTQEDIIKWRYAYSYDKYGFEDEYDPRTIRETIKNLILELDPYEYSEAGKDKYKILYKGYEEDLLKKTLEDGAKGRITDLSYSHDFSFAEMDQLIEAVCFSDMLTDEDKTNLVKKIFATASEYYKSPFWDRKAQRLLFNTMVVHGRRSKKFGSNDLAVNNVAVQKAILDRNIITFKFNCYNADGELEPVKQAGTDEDRIYILRPYHLVVYHDNYYCLGFHEGSNNIYHYRVDLMSDIDVLRDTDGNPVTEEMVPINDHHFVGDFWNPGNYMAEHLYMAYGKPREIKIKVDDSNKRGFTFLHDWFGDRYEVDASSRYDSPDSIVVTIKADPGMLVHWAMQYAGVVEVLDDEVREMIRKELEMMRKKYE